MPSLSQMQRESTAHRANAQQTVARRFFALAILLAGFGCGGEAPLEAPPLTQFVAPEPYAKSDFNVKDTDLTALPDTRAVYGIYSGASYLNAGAYLQLVPRIASLAVNATVRPEGESEDWSNSLVVLQVVAGSNDIYNLRLRLKAEGPTTLRVTGGQIDVFDAGRLNVQSLEGTVTLTGGYAELRGDDVAVVQRTLRQQVFNAIGIGLTPDMPSVADSIGVPGGATLGLEVTFKTAERGAISLNNQFFGLALGLSPAAAQTLAAP